jgi:hypothetical protein
MPQIVAALFADQGQAQRALQALMGSGVARDRIAIVGEGEGREVSSISGFRELSARDDVLAELHDLPLPDEDLQLFEDGLRRGHVLMSARVDRDNMEEAMRVIDMFDPIDVDRESESWARERGGSGPNAGGADVGAPLAAGLTAGMGTGTTNTPAVPGMGTMTDHTHDVGSADLRTTEAGQSGESDLGLSTTTATGQRRAEERAGRPGVLDLDQGGADASLAAKMAPGTGGTASGRGNTKPDLYRRETVRIGRVRAYSRD